MLQKKQTGSSFPLTSVSQDYQITKWAFVDIDFYFVADAINLVCNKNGNFIIVFKLKRGPLPCTTLTQCLRTFCGMSTSGHGTYESVAVGQRFRRAQASAVSGATPLRKDRGPRAKAW